MEITCLGSGDHRKVVYNDLLIFAVTRNNHKLVLCRKDWRTYDQKKYIYSYKYAIIKNNNNKKLQYNSVMATES